jgi:inositol transport system ATP-binding protein
MNIKGGNIYALVGENGAGKSTMMNILSGNLTADKGEIIINGEKAEIKNPLQGIKNGISMIHQELAPVPEMTIAENIFLGREDTRLGLINYREMNRKAKDLLKGLDDSLNVETKLKDLKVSDIQLVEIAKAISYDSRIIIMDEPTSSLSKIEIDRLFKVVKDLKKKGTTIIFISHKLEEIFSVCDEIFVLRDGKMVGSDIKTKDINEKELASLMIGRKLNEMFPRRKYTGGEVCLEVKNLSSSNGTKNVNFELREGEILGIFGLVGAGRSQMAETLFGLVPNTTGDVFINGKKVKIKSPIDAIKNEICFVTEDRKTQGLFLEESIRENITISAIKKVIRNGFISAGLEKKHVNKKVKEFDIRSSGMNQLVRNLSGGNQQKVVFAKWMMTDPKILILDEPTRGIDVGAKFEIYKIIDEMAKQGAAIIFISSELEEIVGISDRVICFHEYNLQGECLKEKINHEHIISLALGLTIG